MSEPPPSLPALSSAELEALVAAASPEELKRALRIVLGASQAYWERDLAAGTIWYSPMFFRLLGIDDTVHDRERVNARVHPEDRAHFEATYAAALARGGPFTYDVRYRNGQGEYRWARAYGRVWLDAAGRAERLIGIMTDVHAEKLAQLEAREAAERYRRALDAASVAHFEHTAGLDDFFLSENFPRLLGHPAGTPAPGRDTWLAWVHPEDRPKLMAELARAEASPCTWECSYRLQLADGGWRWFRGRGRSELDAAGRVRMSGMMGDAHQQQLDRDELDQHRRHLRSMVAERTEKLDAALAEAQQQRQYAERASRAKSEFLAHMSHELRTPLNGMLGLTELALRAADQPAQRHHLEVALASGRALLQLISEVLDYSRLDASGVSLIDEPFDLADTLAEVLRAQMPTVRAKGLSLRFDWVGEHTRVRGDPVRVRQVVTHLVSNAAKFTRHGHVSLVVEMVDEGGGRGMAVAAVEDSGPGIEPERQRQVFEPFVQGDASLTRAHGGTGLGLAVARSLARAMGGDVTLERSDARGSRFVFRWPVTLLSPARPPAPIAPGHAWLVYLQPDAGRWMQRRFARVGWTGETVPGIAAAIDLAGRTASPPALVVVPEQALDAAADLSALVRALPGARIVLLVGADWNQPHLERRAAALGLKTFVSPLTPRDLGLMLAPDVAAPLPPAEPSTSGTRVLVVEDNAVNRMIAMEFVRQLGHEVQGAADGAAAIAACEQTPPQLVLMDLQMPVMDGIEATRRLRAAQKEGRLPGFSIVALSAHAGSADRAQAAAAGMDDYLTKPLLFETLREVIEQRLSRNTPTPTS